MATTARRKGELVEVYFITEKKIGYTIANLFVTLLTLLTLNKRFFYYRKIRALAVNNVSCLYFTNRFTVVDIGIYII